jgi:hypothetical protein
VSATRISAAGVLAVLLMITEAASAAVPSSVEGAPVPTLAPMIKRVSPAIVNISASGTVDIRTQNPLFDDPSSASSSRFRRGLKSRRRAWAGRHRGCGEGLILTNHHVVEGADKINVTLLTTASYGQSSAPTKAPRRRPEDSRRRIFSRSSSAIPTPRKWRLRGGVNNPFGFRTPSPRARERTPGGMASIPKAGGLHQTDASINPQPGGRAITCAAS